MPHTPSKCLGAVLDTISKLPPVAQIIIGGATGFLVSYGTMKVGKYAAFAVGGTILVLELAHEQGCIKIDWDKLSREVEKAKDNIGAVLNGKDKEKAKKFFDSNARLAVAFVGGVFLGIGCAWPTKGVKAYDLDSVYDTGRVKRLIKRQKLFQIQKQTVSKPPRNLKYLLIVMNDVNVPTVKT